MINERLTTQLCSVSVVVNVDAELDESSVDDVTQTEGRIVSQWREISADEQRELRDRVDEILRPLGLQTKLLVVEHANIYFLCMTLVALWSLRDQWSSGQLKDIVESLFTCLSAAPRTVYVKKLAWPLTEYQRCSEYFSQGQQTSHELLDCLVIMSKTVDFLTLLFLVNVLKSLAHRPRM